MMLREPFWPEAVEAKDIPPLGLAAGFALQALVGVPTDALLRIPVAGTLPKGAARQVLVPVHTREERARITAAAAQVVAAWKRVRPEGACDNLIVTLDGGPARLDSFLERMAVIAKTLGLAPNLSNLALRFFSESFFASAPESSRADHRIAFAEAKALDAYRARFDGRVVAPTLTPEQQRLVIERVDPFPEAGKEFLDDDAALASAHALGTSLPSRFLACFAAASAGDVLPADHPLRRELADTAWTRDPSRREAQCAAIYRRHLESLATVIPAGRRGRAMFAPLFGISLRRFSRIARTVEAEAGHAQGTPPRWDTKAELTTEQATRIAAVEALVPPKGRAQMEDFKRDLLRKQGPFVFGLVRDGTIENDRGAALLHAGMTKFIRMKRDFLVGLFDFWLAPPLSKEETLVWKEFVLARAGERRESQPLSDFIRDLRVRFLIPLSEVIMRDALTANPAAPKAEPVARLPKGRVYLQLTEAETERLAEISRRPIPAVGRNAREDHLRTLFTDHGEFIFDLVLARKISLKKAAEMSGIQTARASDLLSLHREGDLGLALVKLTRADEIERSRLLVRELEVRGAEKGLVELLRDIRRRHRIFIPMHVAVQKVCWLRSKGILPAGITNGCRLERRNKVPLTADERRRLKALSSTAWQTAADVDGLRRSVLAADGDFLMRLLDLRKIELEEAAKLTHLREDEFVEVRIDWRAGLGARHVAPPPDGKERERQLRILHDELLVASADERQESFIRRVGGLGVLLSRDEISYARNCALRPPAP
jgi:hypothetical protein